jgi:hypothetical protein
MQRPTRDGKGGRASAAKANAHRRRGGKGGRASAARGQGEDGAIAEYLSARSTSSAVKTVKTSCSSSSHGGAAMSASTRLMFTIAGCALSLAAVGSIALCLVVLL